MYLNLTNKLIIAAPYTGSVTCFNKSLIYILVHDKSGTLGVIVNKVIDSVSAPFLYDALDISCEGDMCGVPVHFGGPVEAEKGLVLHTSDYKCEPVVKLDSGLCLSSNSKILKDIANGYGPIQNMLILGYTGWKPGQLEQEIKQNNWLIAPFNPDLIFSNDNSLKWNKALSTIKVTASNYHPVLGTA